MLNTNFLVKRNPEGELLQRKPKSKLLLQGVRCKAADVL